MLSFGDFGILKGAMCLGKVAGYSSVSFVLTASISIPLLLLFECPNFKIGSVIGTQKHCI